MSNPDVIERMARAMFDADEWKPSLHAAGIEAIWQEWRAVYLRRAEAAFEALDAESTTLAHLPTDAAEQVVEQLRWAMLPNVDEATEVVTKLLASWEA